MTVTFDIGCNMDFYSIKCSANAQIGHSLINDKEHISKMCIEFIRLIREDALKYKNNRIVKLNESKQTLFTTSTTKQGYLNLKKFLKDEYFILYDITTSNKDVSYIKTISNAEARYFYKKIEDFRCVTPIEFITDIY